MPDTIAPAVRDRLALALDTDDLVDALRTARDLEPWFAVAKVGLELFSATGPEVVTALVERGAGDRGEVGHVGRELRPTRSPAAVARGHDRCGLRR